MFILLKTVTFDAHRFSSSNANLNSSAKRKPSDTVTGPESLWALQLVLYTVENRNHLAEDKANSVDQEETENWDRFKLWQQLKQHKKSPHSRMNKPNRPLCILPLPPKLKWTREEKKTESQTCRIAAFSHPSFLTFGAFVRAGARVGSSLARCFSSC